MLFLLISERISTPFHLHRQNYLSWAKWETGRWTDNCLICQPQRDVTSNTRPSWRPVTSAVKLGGVLIHKIDVLLLRGPMKSGETGTEELH